LKLLGLNQGNVVAVAVDIAAATKELIRMYQTTLKSQLKRRRIIFKYS
jgi:hypothetical protein